MVDGTKIQLGGSEYNVPALNFRLLRKFEKEIAAMQELGAGSDPMQQLLTMVPVITAALQRNYPDLDEEKVTDLLDLGNYKTVFEAVLGITPEMRDLLKSRLAAIAVGGALPLPKAVQ